MHRLKRVMKALSSQIFKTQRGTTRRDMIPNIREHMLHMREEEEFRFLELTLVQKKARETCQKKGTRENKILFSSLCSERVCLLHFLVIVRA